MTRAHRPTLTVVATHSISALVVRIAKSPPGRRFARTRVGRRGRSSRWAAWAIGTMERASTARAIVDGDDGTMTTTSRALTRDAFGQVARAANGTPFVVLCMARTGSELLTRELGRRWPEIRCQGEEYGPNRRGDGETTAQVSARVFRTDTGHRIVGAKLFYWHVRPSELQDIVTTDGMKVVHLRRRNHLRRYVSLQIAQKTQAWARGPRQPAPTIEDRAVTIDVDHFIDLTVRSQAWYRRVARIFAEHDVDVLDVWYEDLGADVDAELRRVAEFLGAGPPAVEGPPHLQRQNPEPLALLVRNYAEVRKALAPTPMRVYLDPADVARRRWRDRHPHRSPTCWPTEQQELLLHAALDPPEHAGDAFVQWRNVSDPHDIDDGSRRLLPLVYRNLRRSGAVSSIDAQLKRTYVEASARNQTLLRTLEGALGRLHDAGVPTLVLKGAALTVIHYRDRGTRPMADLDVMVPSGLVEPALCALRVDGWTFVGRRTDHPVDELVRVRHSVALRRGDDELDLHWHAFAESMGTDLDEDFWGASFDMKVGGVTTRALCPADQLLHAFVHGLRYNPIPPVRWVADAHVVVTSSGERVDWDRLVRLARSYRLGAPVVAAVTYLDGRFPTLVPAPALAAARLVPITRPEQRAFDDVTHPHWVLGSSRGMWRAHRRRTPDRGILRLAIGFVDDLRVLYDLERARDLPGRVLLGLRERRQRDRAPR